MVTYQISKNDVGEGPLVHTADGSENCSVLLEKASDIC